MLVRLKRRAPAVVAEDQKRWGRGVMGFRFWSSADAREPTAAGPEEKLVKMAVLGLIRWRNLVPTCHGCKAPRGW